MKKKLFKVFVFIFILFFITGCTIETSEQYEKRMKKEEEEENTDFKWKDYTTKQVSFSYLDSKSDYITNIFNHIGYYTTSNKDGSKILTGCTIETLYSELKKYEDTNKFAKELITEIDNLNISGLSTLEVDYLNMYLKLLFVDVNSRTKVPIVSLDNIEDLGKADSIYIDNYSDDYMDFNNGYYRVIYCHLENTDEWIINYCGNLDDNYIIFVDDIDIVGDTKKVSTKNLNNIIKNSSSFFNLLTSYRNKIYTNKVEEKIKAAENSVKLEPVIGMTKAEVYNSTWGRPDSINKTTTKYGTHEQLVYDKKGYIYIDDGIVTSIQETH